MTHPLDSTRAYYEDKILVHGAHPQGVDWGHPQAQQLRFKQLLKLLPAAARDHRPSINDLGCGYGALLDYLQVQGLETDYLGIDLVPAMIDAARSCHGEHGNFVVGSGCPRVADYAFASGLFNVHHSTPEPQWREFILGVLQDLNQHSRLGFAFNCLTSYSDADRMRPDLYYGDPLWFFDWCKRNCARNVALLHDYDLYDFTIIVRKDAVFSMAQDTGSKDTQ